MPMSEASISHFNSIPSYYQYSDIISTIIQCFGKYLLLVTKLQRKSHPKFNDFLLADRTGWHCVRCRFYIRWIYVQCIQERNNNLDLILTTGIDAKWSSAPAIHTMQRQNRNWFQHTNYTEVIKHMTCKQRLAGHDFPPETCVNSESGQTCRYMQPWLLITRS